MLDYGRRCDGQATRRYLVIEFEKRSERFVRRNNVLIAVQASERGYKEYY